MDTNVNENEVSTVESSAPQTDVENTEVTSVSSTNNYTQDKSSSQDTEGAIAAIKAFVRSRQSIKPNFFEGKEFKHNKLGSYMISNAIIARLHGIPHCYTDGIYKYDDELIEWNIVKLLTSIKPAEIKLVKNFITTATKQLEKVESSYNYVGFNNGVDNFETSEFTPYPTNFVLTSKLNIDYVQQDKDTPISADVDKIDKFISKLCGRQCRTCGISTFHSRN